MARIKIHGSVRRDGKRFRACVRINSGTAGAGVVTVMPAKTFRCAYGRNPRTAIAGAMRKAASHIAARKGRFKGLR